MWSNTFRGSRDHNIGIFGGLLFSLPYRWWLPCLFCRWLGLKDDIRAFQVRVLLLFWNARCKKVHWIKNLFPSLNTFQYFIVSEKKEEWLDFFLINLFIYFWLCWVFVAAHGLSLVAVSRGYSLLRCASFSLQWLLLLRSMGSRRVSFSGCGAWAQ